MNSRHFAAILCVLLGLPILASAQDKESKAPEKTSRASFESDNGDRLSWGVDIAVLRISVLRPDNEPARLRRYATKVDIVPAEFGFFVSYEPSGSPWRLRSNSGEVQLLSPSAFFLVGPSDPIEQSSVSIGIGMGFFDNTLMLGLAIDLYRGVPTLSADGQDGKETAGTGVVGWALSPTGELTPENVALVLKLNLGKVVGALTGTEQ